MQVTRWSEREDKDRHQQEATPPFGGFRSDECHSCSWGGLELATILRNCLKIVRCQPREGTVRFFMIWAYFASPWFSATCHKAIRNIQAFQRSRRGDVPAKATCLSPYRTSKSRAKPWHRDAVEPVLLSRPHPMSAGSCHAEKEGGAASGHSQ